MNNHSLKELLSINTKYYRKQNNLTQEQLAELSDISPRYVSDIENDNANISLDKLERLAIALQIDAYKLISPPMNKK